MANYEHLTFEERIKRLEQEEEKVLPTKRIPIKALQTKLSTDLLPDGDTFLLPQSVGESSLEDQAVTAAKLGNASVTDAKLGVQIVRGRVGSTGSVADGTGFTSVKTTTGEYDVTFSPAFATSPINVITLFGAGASAVKILTISASVMHVLTFVASTGASSDSGFDFICMARAA